VTPYRIPALSLSSKKRWMAWRVTALSYVFSHDHQLRAVPGQILNDRMFRWTAWLFAQFYVATYGMALIRVGRIEEI
jgi:hypothetical protein